MYRAVPSTSFRFFASEITSPMSGSNYVTSQFVNFQGRGFDPDSPFLPMLAWSSDIDGVLGNGNSISVRLTAGMHIISLTATDVEGLRGQARIVVNVMAGQGIPTAQILSPAAESSFSSGDAVTFKGRGFDPEDGDLSGTALQWSSDVDGPLGTGTIVTTRLKSSNVSPIRHTITLEVTDRDGNVGRDQIRIFVGLIE